MAAGGTPSQQLVAVGSHDGDLYAGNSRCHKFVCDFVAASARESKSRLNVGVVGCVLRRKIVDKGGRDKIVAIDTA